MMIPLFLGLAIPQTPAGPPDAGIAGRFRHCTDLAARDPAAALAEAARWGKAGGSWFAQQCAGLAHAQQGDWAAAATDFEAAARAAQAVRDTRAGQYWAQAGNAWLAGGQADKARAALEAALAGDTLTGLQLGEAQLDLARALVATGDNAGARDALDRALVNAAADPLAWLLSATLARRTGTLPRAQKDIAEALRLAGDDPSVQLEAGNIAAAAGDAAGARAAWSVAARIAPDRPAGRQARAALDQFGPTAAAPGR